MKLQNGIALACVTAASLSISEPAAAERVETFWLLEPIANELNGTVPTGAAFLEQRLLPAKLAKLTEPVTIGDKTLPAGTYLYMVFNAARRIGYCTLKDRSPANLAKSLFIPILDQRPCFVDSDGDGRFDRTFSVYDKDGGPPSVRGSIDAATPLGTSVAFQLIDRSEFPRDMRMSLRFTGSRKQTSSARVAVSFNSSVHGRWEEIRGKRTPRGTLFSIANVDVLLKSVDERGAQFELMAVPEIYISTNNRNTLFWGPLPIL